MKEVLEEVLEEDLEEVLGGGVLKEKVGESVLEEEDVEGVVVGRVMVEEIVEGREEAVLVLTTFAKLRVLKVGFSLRKINLACVLETRDLACTAEISASNLYS